MSDTAISKITDDVHSRLQDAFPDVFWFVERSDQEPLADTELPGTVIRALRNETTNGPEHGQWSHLLTMQFDCQSGGQAGMTIDRVNQNIIADIIKTLHASDELGGMVEIIQPDWSDSSEMNAPDVGWAVLQVSIVYYTPAGDVRTILGPNGQIF